uniref:Cytochrome P450 n=1 Tax=Phanerodontia chrysosporium TaxID=2822231 RepID=G5EJQ8_PHACH|nr:cytochrome P450 [Phanerodontia chrysosporium]
MLDRSVLLPCLVGIVAAIIIVSRRGSERYRFPPGPKPLPLIGNLLDAPTDLGWYTYAKWARQYDSDIIHFEVFGQHFYILNSVRVAKDLLERRSQVYADRQQSVMVQELTGWHRVFSMKAYGESWRQQRRLFHQHFRQQAIPEYHAELTNGARMLLRSFLESPDHFLEHIRHISGGTILAVLYGIDVDKYSAERMESIEKAIEIVTEIADGGVYLVDFIPLLKYLPTWFPGAGFKRRAAEWRIHVETMFEAPYGDVKRDMKLGTAKPCVATKLMSAFGDKAEDPEIEELLICVTGTAYAASDTIVFAMIAFVRAMMVFPEVQCKAQQELDRVVGRDRLPVISDQASLPYLAAVTKELLRWHPITPIAVPHKSTTDDWYDGYYVAAGSIVIANVWAMFRDEERYPDPEAFRPERFLTAEGALDPAVPDPVEVFGFGRRMCAGRHYVDAALFLATAHVLHALTIEKPRDAQGNVVEPPPGYALSRLFWAPEPFEADIKPRFEGVERLVQMSSLHSF